MTFRNSLNDFWIYIQNKWRDVIDNWDIKIHRYIVTYFDQIVYQKQKPQKFVPLQSKPKVEFNELRIENQPNVRSFQSAGSSGFEHSPAHHTLGHPAGIWFHSKKASTTIMGSAWYLRGGPGMVSKTRHNRADKYSYPAPTANNACSYPEGTPAWQPYDASPGISLSCREGNWTGRHSLNADL